MTITPAPVYAVTDILHVGCAECLKCAKDAWTICDSTGAKGVRISKHVQGSNGNLITIHSASLTRED